MTADGSVNALQAERAPGMPPRVTDRVADLTTSWSRQEIAERQEISEGLLRQPLTAFHKFLSKIAEMRDRTSERGQAEPEENQKRFENGLSKTSCARFLFASGLTMMVFAS
jgi:hypothetical protein